MFILGKEKQLSTEDSTRQLLLLRLILNLKKQKQKQKHKQTKRQAHFLKYSSLF